MDRIDRSQSTPLDDYWVENNPAFARLMRLLKALDLGKAWLWRGEVPNLLEFWRGASLADVIQQTDFDEPAPHFKTFTDFRNDNGKAIRDVCHSSSLTP
jgi:hypothetical protein